MGETCCSVSNDLHILGFFCTKQSTEEEMVCGGKNPKLEGERGRKMGSGGGCSSKFLVFNKIFTAKLAREYTYPRCLLLLLLIN